MAEVGKESLLKNKRVLDEISRHQWIESEKMGRDIGFEQAAEEWLVNFSKAWMDYHMPKQIRSTTNGKSLLNSKKGSAAIKGKSTSATARKRKTAKSE
jgi:hypothetical protein